MLLLGVGYYTMKNHTDQSEEITVELEPLRFTGTLWMPQHSSVLILMIPGSGASDRHNDVFFPPIRAALLEAGMAVCSFDKRGVGGSTGSWLEAGIIEQARDMAGIIHFLRAQYSLPIGVFGHSQGAWVALEVAANDSSLCAVITNSGPGVSPAEQDWFAAHLGLLNDGTSPEVMNQLEGSYETMLKLARENQDFAALEKLINTEPVLFKKLSSHAFVAPDAEHWKLFCLLIDYQPRTALERLEMPVLALFGSLDTRVPVEQSVAVYTKLLRNQKSKIKVFPEADHRLEHHGQLVEGYLEQLISWMNNVLVDPVRV
jgi:uncharacterized protein